MALTDTLKCQRTFLVLGSEGTNAGVGGVSGGKGAFTRARVARPVCLATTAGSVHWVDD